MNKLISKKLLKIKELQNTIQPEVDKLFKQVESLRKRCNHEDFTTKKGRNTGNQCEEDNIYWINVFCNDCGWSDSFYYHEDKVNYCKYS